MTQTLATLEKLIPSTVQRLVAAEGTPHGKGTLFRRTDEGAVESVTVPFHPWLLVADEELAETVPDVMEHVPLHDDNVLKHRLHFSGGKAYSEAIKILRKTTGYNPSDPKGPYRAFNDFSQQLLSLLPARLFRGMVFGDLRRLQLDIETLTTPGFDFPNAERKDDRIAMIAMRDTTGWELCLSGPELSEEEILHRMIDAIAERDPDVIEGHNIFDFDLSFIETRCRRHKIRLAIGREGRIANARSSRFTSGERTSSYRRFDIFGRHVIDTLQLAQLYDVVYRELESYGLKDVAVHFGVAAPNRTYVAGETITEVYRENPALLQKYAMDDVRETSAISEILSPSYFYQAQLVPFSYQNCVTRGSAARIDAMLVGEYMRRNASLPRPQPPRPFRGGLTESQQSGIFNNVWHVDVRSLYPSIMVSRKITPRSDSQGVFLSLLSELRQFRLETKDAMRQCTDRGTADHYKHLQSSFKILINSFYGYLGFSQATFNDFDLAESITAEGRRILQDMVNFLKRRNAAVIELDTDGIYFVPPSASNDTIAMEKDIQSILPHGIEVDLDATYQAMFSYKSKNYALLTHEGQLAVTGAALKSRGLESFQRRYMHDLITLLLTGREAEAETLYQTYEKTIANHKLPLEQLAKREVLSTPPRVYAEKLAAGKTRRSAAYELALAADRDYNQGDQLAFYITGDKKNVTVAEAAKLLTDADPNIRDENIPYYLDKLKKLHTKFAAFIPDRTEQNDLLPGL
ncbi:MAG: DNA polymerase II [Candidatus Pacebacteria bacterium]|nr:DNA polymerase II [Candidatus Paceibacterota bacterium]